MAIIDRKKVEGRNRDGIIKTRKPGFSKFSYQPSRGKIYKFTPQIKKVDVKKHIYKQYGRSNLSMMNRRYYKRGGNTFFFKNKRRLGNKFQDRSFGNINGHDSFFRKSKGNNFRKGRVNFRNTKRRTMYNKKTEVLHGKIGKLSSKTLDEELDNYMGTSNIKTRLDNDLESYFKNSGILQVDVNKGFNKVAE